ncbi:hypothetical protein LZ32DRAFT_661752 [Colletotrichum eremochloae]|nr:hypothetical protein LZ32DRAFT_661752 [Colletotrichum eremochloae]
MQFQNLLLTLATLYVGAQADFECRCKTDATTTTCCSQGDFVATKLGNGKLFCGVNNIVSPLPDSFPFKTCCGSDFDTCL